MASRTVTLTIASGGTNSDAVDVARAESATIYPPATLTGTVTVQVSGDSGSTFLDLQSEGSDVDLTVSKALTITSLAADSLRLNSSGAEGDDRSFVVKLNDRAQS